MARRNYVVNADTIASDLLACKNAFEKVGIPWVITDGIVLGYARNKKDYGVGYRFRFCSFY